MKIKNSIYFKLLALVFATSCVTDNYDSQSPSESFKYAKKPYDNEDYETALNRLGEFTSKYPYSRYSTKAELLIADSYFNLKKYPEASVKYETFVKLHPKHPKIDLALYRVGLSYWNDAPENIDREQQFTKIALNKWQVLINNYPNSSYSKKARKYRQVGKKRLAEADLFSANFYCQQEIWHSCAYKSEIILERHKEYKYIYINALKNASHAFVKLADHYQKDSVTNIYYRSMSKEELLNKSKDLKKEYNKKTTLL